MKKLNFIFLFYFFTSPAFSFEWSEAHLGIGVYSYDNIRLNNQKTFLKTKRIYEPIPTFQFRLGPLFINKDGAGIALAYFKYVKLIALALYEGEPYRTDGMEERKKSFHIGGGFRIFDLEILYYQDIQSRSNGKVLKVFYAPSFEKKNYIFSPRVYAQFWDSKYVDYFFGVKSNEVTSARSQYRGKRTTNYGFMLQNVWNNGNMKYILSGGYKFYGPPVYNSPTVTRKNEQRIVLGIMYKFF